MKRRRRPNNANNTNAAPAATKKFWGDEIPVVAKSIRPSPEPAAMVHSLGAPPLAGHETAALHYFTAVYEKAVMLAGALAAAGGLLQSDDETEIG